MTNYNDQSRLEFFCSELDASDLRSGDNVAGYANHKQVTKALIEDQLGGHSRVRTAVNYRERVLSFGNFGAARFANVSLAATCFCDKPRIARTKSIESFS